VLVGLPGPLVTPASYRRPQPSRCAAEHAELSRPRLLPPSAVLSRPPGTPSAPLLPPPTGQCAAAPLLHRPVRRHRSIASQASAPPPLQCCTGQCASRLCATAPVLHRPVRQPPLLQCSTRYLCSSRQCGCPVL
jgi:hypothetical protein